MNIFTYMYTKGEDTLNIHLDWKDTAYFLRCSTPVQGSPRATGVCGYLTGQRMYIAHRDLWQADPSRKHVLDKEHE